MSDGGGDSPHAYQSDAIFSQQYPRPDLLMNSPVKESQSTIKSQEEGKENNIADFIFKTPVIAEQNGKRQPQQPPSPMHHSTSMGSKIPQFISRIPSATSTLPNYRARKTSNNSESVLMSPPPTIEESDVQLRSKPQQQSPQQLQQRHQSSGIPKLTLSHSTSNKTSQDDQQCESPSLMSPLDSMTGKSNRPSRSITTSAVGAYTTIKLPTAVEDSNTRINRMSLDFHQRRRVTQSMSRCERERSNDVERISVPTMSITSDDTSNHPGSSTNDDDIGLMISAKINSLKNVKHKPGGGQVKIFNEKVDFVVDHGKCDSFGNIKHKPGGGNVQIVDVKVKFSETASSKVGSLANVKHKPGGGDVQIENRPLDFVDKAAPKVKSLEKVKHKPKGGDKKIFHEKLPWLKYNRPNLPPEEIAKINKHSSGASSRKDNGVSRESLNSTSRSTAST